MPRLFKTRPAFRKPFKGTKAQEAGFRDSRISSKEEQAPQAFYIGIDPGKSGGIAVLTGEGEVVEVCHLQKEKDSLGLLQRYTHSRLPYYDNDRKLTAQVHIILERVHASRNAAFMKQDGHLYMGVRQAFGMGEAFGWIQGILHALELPYSLVEPSVWQGYMKCLTGGDKKITKRKAERLFPSAHVVGWNADALLIAEYARRIDT